MLKNSELYFIHGWGYDHNTWNNWVPFINQEIPFYIFDRGYFKSKKQEFSFNISFRHKILITHSFGLHFLPPIAFTQIHLLVLINGFRYFHEHNGNNKFSKKQIALMKQKLADDPRSLLANFYTNCGLPDERVLNTPLINHQLLHDDLFALDDNQIDLELLKQIPKVLLLHGANDRIVNVEHSSRLSKQLSNSKLFIHKEAEHVLPLTETQWCIDVIQSQLNKKIFVSIEANSFI